MPDYEHIRVKIDSDAHRSEITFCNGPQNILDFKMMDEIRDALVDLEKHHEISVILFRGDGENFSAGVDIPSHVPEQASMMLGRFHAVIRQMAKARKVLIAQITGNCFGGAAELALLCDIVYTADDAKWGFPEIKLGCFPPVACAVLSAAVGQKRAAQLILTGEPFSGADATKWGLANCAPSKGEVEDKVKQCLDRIAKLSSSSLRFTKSAMYTWHAAHLDEALKFAEQVYREDLIGTEDMAEGIRAWMEKREPKWTGK